MSDIRQIELSIDAAKEHIALRDAALKLAGNREFKKVFMDGYFDSEAKRLVGLSADSLIKDSREEIFLAIQGISVCQQFLKNLVHLGNMAERELAEHEVLLDETRAAEDEDQDGGEA